MTTRNESIAAPLSASVGGNSNDANSYPLLDRGGFTVLIITAVVFLGPAVAWVAWGPTLPAGNSSILEIRMLAWSALLSLFLPVAQIFVHIRRFGGDTIRGNRDDYPVVVGAAARIVRAHMNLIESLVPFAAIILSVQVVGVSNRVTLAAAVTYFASRLVHAVSYVFGFTVIRSAAFYGGLGATLAAAFQLPLL